MKVKICGITNLEDALLAQQLGADALGFIFYEKSKRYISPEKAKTIINNVSPFIMKVGVFVNEKPAKINEIANDVNLNMVQLHGEESMDEIEKINCPVIKSFRIKDEKSFEEIKEYKNVYLLLDTYDKENYGGTGKTFDWSIIPDELKNRVILSGGISANNIELIYKEIRPAAVDLSSSLEKEQGKKDEEKCKIFFKKLNHLRS